MYQFCTTERNNLKANEFETKSLLYLLNYRKDSNQIESFLIDCFNDVTGVSEDAVKLWDVQSKNVQSLNPRKIGVALITLFQNYLSEIDFQHYILFMPKLKELYLQNSKLSVYYIDNFYDKYQSKISNGLYEEYIRRNKKDISLSIINDFLAKATFVNTTKDKIEYIKSVVKFKKIKFLEDKFFITIFDEIRDRQTKLKNIDIEGKKVSCVKDTFSFEKFIRRNDIDMLIINRFVGIDLFTNSMIPNSFFDEVKDFDSEKRKDLIEDCNASISKVIFNKNNKRIFWNFFENAYLLVKKKNTNSPRVIYNELIKKKVRFPVLLDELSAIYLISLLEEVK